MQKVKFQKWLKKSKVKYLTYRQKSNLLEIEISDNTREVALMIAGYIAKKFSKRKVCAICKVKMIADETIIKSDEYLRTLPRGGLICPSPPLKDFVFQSFGTLDYISQIIQNITKNVSFRKVTKEVLRDLRSNSIIFMHIQQ